MTAGSRHNGAVKPTQEAVPAPRAVRLGMLAGRAGRHRVAVGWLFGATALVSLTSVLVHNRGGVSVATSLSLFLLIVVATTAIGGRVPGITAALVAPLLANWYLIPPYHTLRINNRENILELSVFLSTAAIVAAYVSVAARRADEAEAARRETYALAEEAARLRKIALEAEVLTRADELRTAILRAVSHDLRTPLASIKASVSSLRQSDVDWSAEDMAEFLASIEDDTDGLNRVVTNLLDLSRLEAGVLRPVMEEVSLEDVVPMVVRAFPRDADRIDVMLTGNETEVVVDSALLERVLVNLVQNALKWSPPGSRVAVRTGRAGHLVSVDVVDHGPGIPADVREVVLQPFHRLGDATTAGGVGLGLAIADRMVHAMDGRLEMADTPGGGLTVSVWLRAAGGQSL